MMVTFVSECEKNALRKTRRILDAFANRIGSNTWQTHITQEGLQAVKKALSSTASKNTAVSCHWIRSRSRCDLVWIVGSKNKFNSAGVVPVNTTAKALIMDKIPLNQNGIFANTKKQLLAKHLFSVGILAYFFIKKLVPQDEALAKCALIAGFLHDIGKLDPQFQNWLSNFILKEIDDTLPDDGVHIEKGKFSFEDHPRHNEISLMIFTLLNNHDNENALNRKQAEHVEHAIYWHHAKPLRKMDYKNQAEICKKISTSLGEMKFNRFFDDIIQLWKEVKNLYKNCGFSDLPLLPKFQFTLEEEYLDILKMHSMPLFKDYSSDTDIDGYINEVSENAKKNLLRSAVISADRIISSLHADELEEVIVKKTFMELADSCFDYTNELLPNIDSCLRKFEAKYPESLQNREQASAAIKLCSVEDIAVLQGPAGCGKTKIALEWALNKSAKKIIWVCPRVQVCLGLYEELTQENYLPNSRIEIYTGEYQKTKRDGVEKITEENEFFSGEIVITTIDQISNLIVTHTKVAALLDMMDSHIIFDEFHELISMPAFNLLFSELISCKKFREQEANTLLVSATPNYFFIRDFLRVDQEDCISVKSFNESLYQIAFSLYDPTEQGGSPLVDKPHSNKTFVITNTAKDAQLGFINNLHAENSLLIHSKYKKEDKLDLFKKVFRNFGENAVSQYEVLRSGPIIQASLNISCDQMFTEFTNAENWLQRLGRLDRFGKNTETNIYTTVVADSIDKGKQQSHCARFLSQQFIFRSAKAWYDFLKNHLDDVAVNLKTLYALYEKFYADEKSLSYIRADFEASLKKSAQFINGKHLDPMAFPKKMQIQANVKRVKRNSLRGDNRFVQMAVCEINNEKALSYPDQYAYSEQFDFAKEEPSLTAGIEQIKGYGENSKNLLNYMAAKHHNIKENFKKKYKDSQLLNEARSPGNPIYLSYTPTDLAKVGGDSAKHPHAIYYVLCEKQPIGAMSIDTFTTQGE